jgi:D-glycerate 3-kinase
MTPDLAPLLRAERLPDAYEAVVRRLHVPLAARIAEAARTSGPGLRVGLCGPQGSGKTTSARVLERLLEADGLRVVILSLDDLYLPLEARRKLAAEVHPLLVTRGVPGTHEVPLGLDLLHRLSRPGQILMPRFDKASDDRLPQSQWTPLEGPFDVILFEGWCVGAISQNAAALAMPVNDLERDRDPDGAWRAYANTQLAGPYQDLFADFARLVMFKVPSFEVVLGWRQEQERKAPVRGMTDAEIAVFIEHYERLTDHIQAETPARADVVVRLGRRREIDDVTFRRAP